MTGKVATAPTGIHRFTSIARPVDPSYPTNKALLILLPIGGALFSLAAYAGLVHDRPPSAAFSIILVGFVAWALTRELAPDDNAAAFLALCIAWVMFLFAGADSVLVLFVTLLLVRVVNRSTGLAARPWDTLAVLLFALWSTYSLDQPLLALVAAAAFAADAVLDDGIRVHWVAAAFSVAAFGWWVGGDGLDLELDRRWLVPAPVLLLCTILAVILQPPSSVGDINGHRLAAARVRFGLLIGCLVGLQSLLHGQIWTGNLIWACLAAVPLSASLRLLFGLRSRVKPS